MCGIVGYTGFQNAENIVLEGLYTLEYRGYDSAGIALGGDELRIFKTAGRVSALDALLPHIACRAAIGHTRWATHGAPNSLNAHPHLSFDGSVAVVHNGVIENCAELRAELRNMGIECKSQTDSEVVAHMLALGGDMLSAVRDVGKRLKGAATFLALKKGDDAIYAYRQGASMAIARRDGECFAASDTLALARHADSAILLADGEYAVLFKGKYEVYKDGKRISKTPVPIRRTPPRECACHMRAEIDEIPAALARTYNSVQKGVDGELLDRFARAKRILLMGCGTAYHACLYAKHIFEKRLHIPCECAVASECDSLRFADGDAFAIFVSQSGETADTLFALEECKRLGAYTLAVTNVEGSGITFAAHKTLYLDAGAEVAVAATKTYDCQLLALYMLARAACKDAMRHDELCALASCASAALSLDELYCDRIARGKLFFVGKGLDVVTAQEGALKFKEITYKQTEAYAAGELKHGTIALMDDDSTVIALANDPRDLKRLSASVSELNSRGAYTVAVTSVGDIGAKRTLDIPRPADGDLCPIIAAIPLQSLALTTSLVLGLDPDKPRNLAKSVTVI